MKVALIGLGMVAETHIRAIADAKGITLACVLGRDLGRANAFADKVTPILGEVPQVCERLDLVTADPSIDAVIICTPPNARLEIVRACAAAGKHILMEKPIERTSAAADEIVKICEDAGVTLGIVFQHRMRESAMMLAEMLAADALGPIAFVDVRVPWWRDQGYYDEPGRGTYARDGGGVLISQAIHTLDLMLALLGPVTRVQGTAHTSALHEMESEDIVTAGLSFASGAVGSLMATTASFPGDVETITLHGTNGSAVLASGQLEIHWRDGRREVKGAAGGTGGGADPMAFTHDWHRLILEDFAAAVAAGRPPAADGRTALRVHHLIDALIRSASEGQAVTLSETTE